MFTECLPYTSAGLMLQVGTHKKIAVYPMPSAGLMPVTMLQQKAKKSLPYAKCRINFQLGGNSWEFLPFVFLTCESEKLIQLGKIVEDSFLAKSSHNVSNQLKKT